MVQKREQSPPKWCAINDFGTVSPWLERLGSEFFKIFPAVEHPNGGDEISDDENMKRVSLDAYWYYNDGLHFARISSKPVGAGPAFLPKCGPQRRSFSPAKKPCLLDLELYAGSSSQHARAG